MSSLNIALTALACMFAGMGLGLFLRRVLPENHIRDDSKDILKIASGMMATLVALIIGLLVSSAKNSFDATNSGLTQGGAKIITLDHILSRYGPETKPIREMLHETIARVLSLVWPEDHGQLDFSKLETGTGMEAVFDAVRALDAKGESQQYLKSQALAISNDLVQSRWMLIEQSQSKLPNAFLIVLIFWLTVLFASFGLLAPRNLTAIGSLFVCAISMAFAVFLILELNRPLEGAIRISSEPMQKAYRLTGK